MPRFISMTVQAARATAPFASIPEIQPPAFPPPEIVTNQRTGAKSTVPNTTMILIDNADPANPKFVTEDPIPDQSTLDLFEVLASELKRLTPSRP